MKVYRSRFEVGERKVKQGTPDDVIAAFDREREEAHEHRRRLVERIRASRENDRPVQTQPQRKR